MSEIFAVEVVCGLVGARMRLGSVCNCRRSSDLGRVLVSLTLAKIAKRWGRKGETAGVRRDRSAAGECLELCSAACQIC